jgi:hypothetical protein
MADHDLLAELAGYRDELAEAEQYERPEKAADVRKEITRVEAAIRGQAAALDRQAEVHLANAQDVLAAAAGVEARRLREGLGQPVEPPATETAQDKAPRERATTTRKKAT